MAKVYTEKELNKLLEENLNNITLSTLDRSKVYIFRINKKGRSTDKLQTLAANLKNMLDRIGIKSIILIGDLIEVTELERN